MLNNRVKIIKIADEEYKCYYEKNGEVSDCYITKDEDKAIHKKLEEMKNESKKMVR